LIERLYLSGYRSGSIVVIVTLFAQLLLEFGDALLLADEDGEDDTPLRFYRVLITGGHCLLAGLPYHRVPVGLVPPAECTPERLSVVREAVEPVALDRSGFPHAVVAIDSPDKGRPGGD
jgi:hypothetical protein